MKNNRKISPWAWVPTLYFAEGLPLVLITMVSIVLLLDMGFGDERIALWTSWLALPWIVKPLWSPFIDVIKTKRWWVLAMQMLLGASFAGVAFALNTDWWFQLVMFFLFLAGFASATHDIAADGYYMIELDSHGQSFFAGIRNTFYRLAVIFGNGALVALAGLLQNKWGIALSWSLIFFGVAGLILGLALWHRYALRKNEEVPEQRHSGRETWQDLKTALAGFFTKFPLRETLVAMLFLLLFRFPEALLTKMAPVFLQRPADVGGLGMTKEAYGMAYGVIGVIGLLLGGILGGILASRDGLKKWLWPMVLALTLPDLVYVWLSWVGSASLPVISSCIFIEQFGYGFGFMPLTLYMLYYSAGRFQTSHYSICTGITYLGLMLPGMFSGYLSNHLGYHSFFLVVMACCLVTFAVTAFIKIDPEFGKKKHA